MRNEQLQIVVRKSFIIFSWTILLFVLTSTCCLTYFSSTAYEFADLTMMETVMEPGMTQPRVAQRTLGAKVIYGIITMQESNIFLGLLAFSCAAAVFAGLVGIIPGTSEESTKTFLQQVEKQYAAQHEELPDHCLNCGTHIVGQYCYSCGQEHTVAQQLTLMHFIRTTIPDILNIDGKFFSTLRLLLTKPGFLTLQYLQAHKARYTLPTQLYFVIAAVFFFVSTTIDFSTDAFLKQSKLFEQRIEQRAKEANKPVEIIKQDIDRTLENYIPFYTFFIIIVFALFLKTLYPKWYYVEHLIFSLHFMTYFLVAWMVLILASVRVSWLDQLGPIISLPYLYLALRRVHPAEGRWKFLPAAIFFVFLFVVYIGIAMSKVFFF
jgi:hypothetical protein